MLSDASPLQDTEFVGAILDLLIPPRADGRVPGAGALGLAETVAADLTADASYGSRVESGLAAVRDAARERNPEGFLALAGEDRLAVFRAQQQEHPALERGLVHYLYLAYYQHPMVLVGLGQPARPPFPEGYEIEQTDPELLALLESRRLPAPDA